MNHDCRNRGDRLLYPNSRVVSINDENGTQYFPQRSHRVYLKSRNSRHSDDHPASPGESYSTTLVFDLPTDIKNPTLLIHEGEFVTHFVIGHENSSLHKKTNSSSNFKQHARAH